MARKNTDYTNIPKEKFEFFDRSEAIHDKKLETKPVGYFKDAMMRFCRNKSSLTAAVIIALLLAFALIVPLVSHNNYTKSKTDTTYLQYGKLLPKSKLFSWVGWDGAKRETISSDMYAYYEAMETERGVNAITKVYKADYEDSSSTSNSTFYDVRVDSYSKIGMLNLTLTKAEYEAIQDWQDENQIQVIYPSVDSKSIQAPNLRSDPNIWYKCTNKGAPKLDKDGNITPIYLTKGKDGDYHSLRIAGDDGSYRYATVTGSSASMSFKVRVDSLSYFQYRYGHEPIFLFGTNAYGQDILTRMAEGARFSLLFALIISAINLAIGAVYGAIEGFYGGAIDLIMERISDILNDVPFIVVTSLFQLHLASKVGVVPSLLFAFVLTGWIGMASKTRMQFYRYKNQEYILAARTLGAKDSRLMFKHIFPNAIGTLITSAVLTIPSVISSESNMTYLGIVNLDSSNMTSLGTMLSQGTSMLTTYPHIILFPAIYISLLMISFNLFGNGLRDAFNPSLRGTEE